VGLDADPPDLLDEVEGTPGPREEGRDGDRPSLAVPLHHELDRLLGSGVDDPRELIEGRDVLPRRPDHLVAGLEEPVRGPVREDGADHRGGHGAVAEEHHEEEDHGEHEVHRRPGEDDDHPPPERLLVEGAPLVLR